MLCHLLLKLTGRSEANCPLKDKHPTSEPGELSCCKSRMSHTAAAATCLQRETKDQHSEESANWKETISKQACHLKCFFEDFHTYLACFCAQTCQNMSKKVSFQGWWDEVVKLWKSKKKSDTPAKTLITTSWDFSKLFLALLCHHSRGIIHSSLAQNMLTICSILFQCQPASCLMYLC